MLWALLRRHARPQRGALAAVAALQIVGTLAALVLPTVNAAIIDDGVARGDTGRIVELGAVMLAVTAGQVACAAGAVYFGSRAGMGFGRDLRSAVFHHVTGFAAADAERFGAATLLTRTTNDVQQIQALLQMTCTTLVTAPLTCVGGIAMAVHLNPGLAWSVAISVPVLAVLNYAVVRRLVPLFRRLQQLVDGVNRVLRDQLAGLRVIRAFGAEPTERARFAAASTALSDTTLAAGRWQALMLPATTLVINGTSVALIWFGGLRIDAGTMQIGSLVALLSYVMQILMAVVVATILAAMLPRASVCAERITAVLATEPSLTSPPTPRRPAGRTGEIRCDGASYRHPGADEPVLRGVDFTAAAGTTTAVVGSTGSGKSTLISLICRLLDVTGGSVRVDGVDVREQELESLWAGIGLVPQRARLFSGTVADNLRYGRADATDDRMWAALEVAAAADFVAAHPEGLAMPIAQGGANLSGGQRQRLAIARAVIRRPAVYLFDDAFSALDVGTEARVRAALRDTAAGATTIVVASRLSTVVDADQIVVLDAGRVVGLGRHDDLLERCPVYAEFAESQSAAVAR